MDLLRWRPPSWPAMNRGRCRCPEMRTSPRRSRSGSRYVLYVQGLINESSRREIALRKYSACLEVHDCCVYSTSCSKHVPGIADPSLRSQPCRRQYTPGVNWEGLRSGWDQAGNGIRVPHHCLQGLQYVMSMEQAALLSREGVSSVALLETSRAYGVHTWTRSTYMNPMRTFFPCTGNG